MKLIKTKIEGLKIIKLKRNNDPRGYLAETYNKKLIGGKELVFDYKVISKKNIFRGFHFQYKFQQVKLISVLKGKILDYVIDLRKNSKTFGKTYKIILSEKSSTMVSIPFSLATFATVSAGSIPKVWKPLLSNDLSNVPSLLPISITFEFEGKLKLF